MSTFITILLIGIIAFYLINKIFINNSLKKLESLKQDMQDLVNPNKCYERLGVDVLTLKVSNTLTSIVDPEQEGQVPYLIAALRYRLTDEYGYIIPNIRMLDDSDLDDNQYVLFVHGSSVAKGKIYPDKILINSRNIKEDILSIEKIKFEGDFLENSQNWYWVNKKDIGNIASAEILRPDEIIIRHIEKVVMDYVEYIFCYIDIIKMEELIKAQYGNDFDNKNTVEIIYDRNLWWYILVNFLKERISVKDICFIVEKITFYSSVTDNWDKILNNIKNDIKKLKNNLIE